MKKNTFLMRALLIVAAILCSATTMSYAYDFKVDGIAYNINDDQQTVTVTAPFIVNNPKPEENYYKGDIVIPPTVAYGGKYYTVTAIGDRAFVTNYSSTGIFISSIYLPNTITDIGKYAFTNQKYLTNINLPASLKRIGDDAFTNTSITEIVFPDGIESIGKRVVMGTKIKKFVVPDTWTEIPPSIFEDCHLETVIIPNSIKTIGYSAFKGTALRGVYIPNSVETIGAYAFSSNNESVNAVYIPNSVKNLGGAAFMNCWIKSISLSPSLTSIGANIIGDEHRWIDYTTDDALITWIPNDVVAASSNTFDAGVMLFSSNVTKINSTWLKSRWISNNDAADPNSGYAINPVNAYCFSQTPPTIIGGDASSTYSKPNIHVPNGSLAKYFSAEFWNKFLNVTADAVEPESITLSANELTLTEGNEATLTPTLFPAEAFIADKFYGWFTSDGLVATVNGGKIIAKGPGECDIYCFFGRAIDKCHVVVEADEELHFNQVVVDKNEIEIYPNEITTIKASLRDPLQDKTITPEFVFEYDQSDIALIRVMGKDIFQVLGLKPGVVTVTVRCKNVTLALPTTCKLFVTRKIADLNIDGAVNAGDVSTIYDAILDSNLATEQVGLYDLNGDGVVNAGDISVLYENIIQAQ